MKKIVAAQFVLITFLFICSCKPGDKSSPQPAVSKSPIPSFIPDEIFPEPTGNKLVVMANIDTDTDFLIPEDCESLFIGGMHMDITKVRGLEQLKKIKRLILFNIGDRGGTSSDVAETVPVLKSVEELCLNNCWRDDLSFISGFENLKLLCFSFCSFENIDTFSFEKNTQLRVFVMVDTPFKNQGYKTHENRRAPITIVPPPSLKVIILDSNYRSITLDKDFLEMNKNVEVYVSEECYQFGMNDDQLIKRYKNVHIVKYDDLEAYFNSVNEIILTLGIQNITQSGRSFIDETLLVLFRRGISGIRPWLPRGANPRA